MQTLFGKYLKDTPPKETEVYELKIVKGKSLPFDSVKVHQREALLDVETKSLYHKITDFPIFQGSKTRFTRPKPFDCICFQGTKAYVVVWFFVPRTKKVFYKIRIKDFLELEKNAGRKSMTEKMVKEIGVEIIV